MVSTIGNGDIEVSVSSYAAELISLKASGMQLLWQGNSDYWSRRAPVLFPIVGSLPDDKYELDGKTYKLGVHGFARNSEFEMVDKSKDVLVYKLTENEDTLRSYPFHFELFVSYRLTGNTLQQILNVKNTDSEVLPFSIGAHPGFNCPLYEDESFEDYLLFFEKDENIKRRFVRNRPPDPECENFLVNGREKALKHGIFDNGAIILSGLKSEWVELRSIKRSTSVRISFRGFPYLIIWSVAKKQAPFICIEPCCGISSADGAPLDFRKKEGLIFLQPGETFERQIDINCYI